MRTDSWRWTDQRCRLDGHVNAFFFERNSCGCKKTRQLVDFAKTLKKLLRGIFESMLGGEILVSTPAAKAGGTDFYSFSIVFSTKVSC